MWTIIPLTSKHKDDNYYFHYDLKSENLGNARAENLINISSNRIKEPYFIKNKIATITKQDNDIILKIIKKYYAFEEVNIKNTIKTKRSVDAYGKAVELSVLSYLMDNGSYPTDLTTLSVEYTGKEIACNVMSLNNDGSIYLSECSVDGIEVKDDASEDGWYYYGKSVSAETSYDYKVGDQVTYNGIEFYVIENSEITSDSITLLKAEPLTVDEVNTYGAGHVNVYVTNKTTASYYQTAYDSNGYGGMAYYGSENCGFVGNGSGVPGHGDYIDEGCTSDYASSDVKYVVDGWSNALINQSDLKIDELGYKARLLTCNELITNLGYDESINSAGNPISNENVPSWLYNSNYTYWTMSQFKDYSSSVWSIYGGGALYFSDVHGQFSFSDSALFSGEVVRPVITLYKSALN